MIKISGSSSANPEIIIADQLESIHEKNLQKKKYLKRVYTVPEGQIVDYMIDYNDENYKLLKKIQNK